METVSTAHETQERREVLPSGGAPALAAFRDAIEGDRKEDLVPGGFPKDPKDLSFLLETSYAAFSLRFKGLCDSSDDPSPVRDDVSVMEEATLALYRTFYTKEPLSSVFPNAEAKERYFRLLGQYVYGNLDRAMTEAAKTSPRPGNGELTSKEVDALLMDEEGYRAKYGSD